MGVKCWIAEGVGKEGDLGSFPEKVSQVKLQTEMVEDREEKQHQGRETRRGEMQPTSKKRGPLTGMGSLLPFGADGSSYLIHTFQRVPLPSPADHGVSPR